MDPIFKYNTFGLNFQSTFEIPELTLSNFTKADVIIQYGNNPQELNDIKGSGVLYQAKKDDFLLRIDTVGSFRVQNGSIITVEKLNNSTDEEVRLFLLGSTFGAMIHQRNLLPFHGSTVVKNGKAIVLGGTSGAGKSSLAATLVNRGYSILADDISVIKTETTQLLVYPGIPHLKLWQDVMEKLNEDISNYHLVRPKLLKYRKPVEDQFHNKTTPLHRIIILSSKNSSGFEAEEKKGVEKFNLLKRNTYRSQYLKGLDKTVTHFKQTSILAANSRVYHVHRPISPLLLEGLADFIEELE